MSREKMYRVRPDLSKAGDWWDMLARLDWPEALHAARPILAGEAAIVDLPTAEILRRWFVAIPGWPRDVRHESPVSFESLGYADETGDPRLRWPIALFTSPSERSAIEAAASRAGITVGSFLRNLALEKMAEESAAG